MPGSHAKGLKGRGISKPRSPHRAWAQRRKTAVAMVFHGSLGEIKGFFALLGFCVLSIFVLFWYTGQFDFGKRHTRTRDLLYAQKPPRQDIAQPSDMRKIYNLSQKSEPMIEEPDAVSNLTNETADSQAKKIVNKGHLMLTLDKEMGRTGNSMFQYASMMGIANSLQREPFILPGWKLEKIFHLTHVLDVKGAEKWPNVTEKSFGMYKEDLFSIPEKNTTIHGYLQSWKYFHHIKEEIIKEFTFRDSIREQAEAIFKDIRKNKQDVLVGVHVRRGDFLQAKYASAGFSVAAATYLFKAFDWFRSRFPYNNVLFLVVSQDLAWCKFNLAGSDVKFMPMASASVHLCLLAKTDHVILTGGTFGWWGAWLAGGHVVYFNNFPERSSSLSLYFKAEDYYPPHWVGLGD